MSGIGRGQVLVMDDDPAIRRSLERGLRLAGFAVALAGGGRPALAHVRREPTDVVVLDISMPDLDGIQVCRALREDGNDLPVLMLLALDETADRIAGLQAGGDDYLIKPFSLQELVLRLDALLRRRPRRYCASGYRRSPGWRSGWKTQRQPVTPRSRPTSTTCSPSAAPSFPPSRSAGRT